MSSQAAGKKGQPNILNFFGGGGAKPAPDASKKATKQATPKKEEEEPPAPAPPAEEKKKRKADEEEEEAKANAPPAVPPAGVELEDDDAGEASPAPVKGRKRLRKAVVDDDSDDDAAVDEGLEDMDEVEEAPKADALPPKAKVHPMFAKKPAGAPNAKKDDAPKKAAKKKKAVVMEGDSEEEEGEQEDDEIEDVSHSPPKSIKNSKPKAKKVPKGDKKAEGVGALAYELAGKYDEYDPVAGATWKPGAPVPYLFLADAFEVISEESKRLVIAQTLANVFRTIIATTPEDLLPCIYLSINAVGPAHEGLELGIGEGTLIKTIASCTGKKDDVIKKQYNEEGDLGRVATNARTSQRTMFTPKPLTLRHVFSSFREIAMMTGNKSQDKRIGKIKTLLVASRESEAGYVIRSLQGKLRIGLAEQTVLQALAHATVLQGCGGVAREKDLAAQMGEADKMLKRVHSECPSYDAIIPALLELGALKLPERCHFVPGVPIKPMLAKPTNGVGEVLARFSDTEFSCEYKYDGERAQVHMLEDGSVHVYSRNLENNTTRYPDLIQVVKKARKEGITSAVLDCEAVAYDVENKKILPFQMLSTRSRKDVKLEDVKVPVMLFAFDLLYLNGKPYLQDDLSTRRDALYGAFNRIEGEFDFATSMNSRDVEEIQHFLDASIEDCTEGLVIKTLKSDATYEPSRRSLNWLKLKKDYIDGLGDSMDVVPIGAWWGKGKRTGVYGAYLLAVYDEETEEFQGLCKIGTGFSEDILTQLHNTVSENVLEQPRSYYQYGSLKPEVWLDAKAVWEIKAADLSISPAHAAAKGHVDPQKGIAVRFPRFLRVREDKGPEQATSASQIADMYRSQAVVAAGGKSGGGGGDEYDE